MQPLQAALALGAALALCLQGQGAQAQPAMPLTDLCAQYPALSMCAAGEPDDHTMHKNYCLFNFGYGAVFELIFLITICTFWD